MNRGGFVFLCRIFIFWSCINQIAFSQTIDIGNESDMFQFKVRNKGKGYSYLIYPLSDDSLFLYQTRTFIKTNDKNFTLGVFSPLTKLQYNSSYPFGWNDGPMIPNKGLQNYSTVGLYFHKGIVSIQFRPELVFAQNQYFKTFPVEYNDSIWAMRYRWFNQIDNPERFEKSIRHFYWGQSNFKLHYKSISVGISSENMWWGPGKNNSLIMSNNAPGFGHLFIQTERPLITKIGKFEFQFISGLLEGSGEVPPDTNRTYNGEKLYQPKPEDSKRYLNGLALVYQPSFLKGLSLGLGRLFYLYKKDVQRSFDGYIPVLGAFFKNETTNEDTKRRDEIFAFYLKQTFDHGESDIYIEYGRNDHAWNLRDLITDFSHSRAYVIGFNKYYQLPKRKMLLNLEFTDLSRSSQVNLRPTPDWYVHYQVVHGFTNLGQIVGAGIGPGSAMQSIEVNFMKTASNFYGFSLYRIERNKDFYYDALGINGQYYRQWVDLALGFKLNKSFRKINLLSSLFMIRLFNYEYQDYSTSQQAALRNGIDVLNLSANITCQYKL